MIIMGDKIEVLSKESRATHKITVLSLTGDDKGKSRSITLSAPDITKEVIMDQVTETLLDGGN